MTDNRKFALIDGIVYDIKARTKQQLNLLFTAGKLQGMGYLPDEDQKDTQTIDIPKNIIIPNIIDMTAKIGDPYAAINENIASASTAAINAGITMVIATPDLASPLDTPEQIAAFTQAAADAPCPILPMGCITKNRDGNQLAEMGLMKEKGAVAFTDCRFIKDETVMKKALKYASMINSPLIIGPEDLGADDISEGMISTTLGLKGQSITKEASNIYRDLCLLEEYGGQLHFSHVTTAKSVDLIRKAKAQGLNVTCGTAPHYLYFNTDDIKGNNPNLKVNPPLRNPNDTAASIEGLKDGTIDVISSLHTPLSIDAKRTDFHSAQEGISSIDLLISLILTKLHIEHKMDLFEILEKITVNPAKILGIKRPGIGLGNTLSLTVIDLKSTQRVTPNHIRSKGKNTPYLDTQLQCFPTHTIINGKINQWLDQ